jgi:hypothetical protein
MRNRVGTVYTSCQIENPIDRKKSVAVPKMLVDSNVAFTRVNARTLRQVGVAKEEKNYWFVTATGQEITRAVGYAIIRVGDAVTIDEVVFGEPGDLEIFGARKKTRGRRTDSSSGAEGGEARWKINLTANHAKHANGF